MYKMTLTELDKIMLESVVQDLRPYERIEIKLNENNPEQLAIVITKVNKSVMHLTSEKVSV